MKKIFSQKAIRLYVKFNVLVLSLLMTDVLLLGGDVILHIPTVTLSLITIAIMTVKETKGYHFTK